MAYRYGHRYQIGLLPQSIEQYVAEDDPVRAYDAFVEALNFNELGIDINPNKVGNSTYDPKAMLKLLVYGYSPLLQACRFGVSGHHAICCLHKHPIRPTQSCP